MGQILIRQIDDDVLAALRERAAAEGKPLERLAREVLGEAARPDKATLLARAEALRARCKPLPADFFDDLRDERDAEADIAT